VKGDWSKTESAAHARTSTGWRRRIRRAIEPPLPLIRNPREPVEATLGRWNLYVGGAGNRVPGYINLDIEALAGVDVAGDVLRLPFPDNLFQHVECDAVLEHVRDPHQAMTELTRVTAPGGTIHVVAPFCHPFHAYPHDYWRFTPAALGELGRPGLVVEAKGWRTGPTATLLAVLLEYLKLLLPWRWWRGLMHGVAGWLLFPLRYLDWWLLRSPYAYRLGNHCYVWFRKPAAGE
jgi:SAM-dependent methyltransferase